MRNASGTTPAPGSLDYVDSLLHITSPAATTQTKTPAAAGSDEGELSPLKKEELQKVINQDRRMHINVPQSAIDEVNAPADTPQEDQTEKAVKSRQKGEAETARANESKGPIRQPTTPTPGTKTPTNVAPVAPVSNKPVKPVVAPIPAGVVKTPIVPAQTSPVKPVVPQGTPTGSPGKTGPGKDLGFKSVPATTSPTVNMNPKPKATAPTTSGTGSSAEQAIQNGAAFLGV